MLAFHLLVFIKELNYMLTMLAQSSVVWCTPHGLKQLGVLHHASLLLCFLAGGMHAARDRPQHLNTNVSLSIRSLSFAVACLRAH